MDSPARRRGLGRNPRGLRFFAKLFWRRILKEKKMAVRVLYLTAMMFASLAGQRAVDLVDEPSGREEHIHVHIVDLARLDANVSIRDHSTHGTPEQIDEALRQQN